MDEARSRGLLDVKTRPLGGRLHEGLLEEAKRVSGIESTTELLTYALARVAIEDDFGPRLVARKGRVARGLLSGD
jgi:chorismate-pyruvate lyase